MNETLSQLINAAKSVCGEFHLSEDFTAGSVAAAILTANGNAHTGICIDLASGLGFCAEAAAIAEMLKHRETHVAAVVAVRGDKILPPCGRCREMMIQVDFRNLECSVIIGKERIVALRELLPHHWLIDNQNTEQGA